MKNQKTLLGNPFRHTSKKNRQGISNALHKSNQMLETKPTMHRLRPLQKTTIGAGTGKTPVMNGWMKKDR